MRQWVLEKLLQNNSFNQLPEKTRYILPNQIAKELQSIYEAKGQIFIDAYKAELSPILLRTQWLWNKNPQFPFQKWSKIKAQMANIMANTDKLTKPSLELIKAQVDAVNACVEAMVEKTTIVKTTKWIKNPNGGWGKT